MVFACQLDSFQTTYSTVVKSCNKVDDIYEVICEDTILFPEGGGQPYDTGYINDIRVEQVLRRGAEAVHYVKSAIAVGETVKQKVDWERRFDHMQQHSGQHLITAVINMEYKFDTTAWWLGEKVSHIELDTPKITEEQFKRIETLVNEKILEQIPVEVKMYNPGDAALQGARTRGLPADVEGPIRMVEIVGIEDDLCCGTHVTNLMQLQTVKLLYVEKGKKNKTNLYFLAGGRVIKYLSETLEREQKMVKLLNNEPAQHPELVAKLQQTVKITSKKLTTVLKELAVYEAAKFNCLSEKPAYHVYHTKDGDVDFLECYLRGLKDSKDMEKTLFMLTAGDEKGNGYLILHGDANIVQVLGARISEVLGGKGAAHGMKFQGKVTKLGNLKKAYQLIKEHFEAKV